jgi:hypothetical protein
MITDFVRGEQAYLRCTECGAESIILKYELSDKYNFPIINNEKTIEGVHAFKTKHALCRNPNTQLKLETI